MRFPASTYREKIWDHAAGFVVVEEAGGKVRNRRHMHTLSGPSASHCAVPQTIACLPAHAPPTPTPQVTDALGDRLDFSKGRYLDTMRLGIIAAPPAIHAALVAGVAAVRARGGSASL